MHTKEDCIGLSESLFQIFVEAVQEAFRDWQVQIPEDWIPTLRSLTRANLIHDRIAYHLTRGLIGFGHARILESPTGFKYLFVQGVHFCLGIRPKKVGRDYKSFNSPTDAQTELRLDGQLMWHEMETVHLFLGYTEDGDEFKVSLSRITLSKENGHGVEWAHVLWKASDDESIGVPDEPSLPMRPMGEGVEVRVKETAARLRKIEE